MLFLLIVNSFYAVKATVTSDYSHLKYQKKILFSKKMKWMTSDDWYQEILMSFE